MVEMADSGHRYIAWEKDLGRGAFMLFGMSFWET
jgi:hypothetical protein